MLAYTTCEEVVVNIGNNPEHDLFNAYVFTTILYGEYIARQSTISQLRRQTSFYNLSTPWPWRELQEATILHGYNCSYFIYISIYSYPSYSTIPQINTICTRSENPWVSPAGYQLRTPLTLPVGCRISEIVYLIYSLSPFYISLLGVNLFIYLDDLQGDLYEFFPGPRRLPDSTFLKQKLGIFHRIQTLYHLNLLSNPSLSFLHDGFQPSRPASVVGITFIIQLFVISAIHPWGFLARTPPIPRLLDGWDRKC